ncbi:type II secretion system protein N [Shewanella surugensis]|uniref:Type II secretion system protein N n=1 Tax=Shewanella surugensis TaxID=212020 RepID=A0ABT0L8I2_9GAMM|nr:type II secretion system protein N [Shewanella surugensis]MCL1124008.1 type II secretion system protein N [Shewanella surugensis]
MSLTKKIIIGLLVYLIFLVATFPAKLVVKFAELPQGLSVAGISGSVWQGGIDSMTFERRQFDFFKWELSPWRLLLGQAQVDFSFGERNAPINGKGRVRVSFSGLYLEDLRFDAPIPLLLGQKKLPFKTQVNGDISLFLNHFDSGKPWCEALAGKAIFNQTEVNNQFGDYPLGNVVFSLSCNKGNIELKTDESQNTLGLVGSLILAEKNTVVIDAKMKETAGQPADLKKMLSQFGAKDSKGYYSLNYKGAIPGL